MITATYMQDALAGSQFREELHAVPQRRDEVVLKSDVFAESSAIKVALS
jgi:hypothetical protein